MKRTTDYLKKVIYRRFPKFQKWWISVNIQPKRFAGWNMVTHAALPWNDSHCPDLAVFNKAREDIKTQFVFGSDLNINADAIDGLLWRHYIVTFATRYALKFSSVDAFNMVEAGVADGITAFFALREAKEHRSVFSMHLYDSWDAMRETELLPSELICAGNYSELNINRTKRNLSEFSENIVYHQGYVPESLNAPPPAPLSVNFMHIDINAAMPTRSLLEFFCPRLAKGGVILFDDYGWAAYEETKDVIDAFFADKSGILLKLPTGQAVYFHK